MASTSTATQGIAWMALHLEIYMQQSACNRMMQQRADGVDFSLVRLYNAVHNNIRSSFLILKMYKRQMVLQGVTIPTCKTERAHSYGTYYANSWLGKSNSSEYLMLQQYCTNTLGWLQLVSIMMQFSDEQIANYLDASYSIRYNIYKQKVAHFNYLYKYF